MRRNSLSIYCALVGAFGLAHNGAFELTERCAERGSLVAAFQRPELSALWTAECGTICAAKHQHEPVEPSERRANSVISTVVCSER